MTTDYTAGTSLPDYAVFEVDKLSGGLTDAVPDGGGMSSPVVTTTTTQDDQQPMFIQGLNSNQVLLAGGGGGQVRVASSEGTTTGASAAGSVVTNVIVAKNLPAASSLQPSGVNIPQRIYVTNQPGPLPRTPTKVLAISSTPPRTFLPGTPPRQLPTSPPPTLRTPTKITMIPVSLTRSPQATGQVVTMVARTVASGRTSTTNAHPSLVSMSPTKLVLKGQSMMAMQSQAAGQQPQLQRMTSSTASSGSSSSMTIGSLSSVQPLPVTGSKFQYVRLVTTSSAQSSAVSKPASIAPAPSMAKTVIPAAAAAAPLKIALSVASTHQVLSKPLASHLISQQQQQQQQQQQSTTTHAQQSMQRLILPATTPQQARLAATHTIPLAQIRPTPPPPPPQPVAPSLSQLPLGTATIISSAQSIPGMQGFAFVPAQYVAQIQQQMSHVQTAAQPVRHDANFVPITSTNVAVPAPRQVVNGSTLSEPSGHRPRKPCNCTKSQCLKLYCDCFANGEFCSNCNCANCANNLEHEEERSRAIKSCLDRNPLAFHPKIGKGKNGEGERRHNKGCNCKRSGCLKNYCECYEAKIPCSNMCKCVGCKNFEESGDRKTLMQLADAAEVRVMQQTAAKTKLASQMHDMQTRLLPSAGSSEKLPYTFVTTDVAEATCSCLIAQAEEAARMKQMEVVQERLILEEFGRCLMQVIESANQTKEPRAVP